MPTIQRKIEVYCLTISGLPEGTAYGPFLKWLRGDTRPVAKMVKKEQRKSHGLNEALLLNHRLRMRFLSFTKGHRPDVLDTNEFSLQLNPLTPVQTNVEWTHVLGGLKNDRYLLLIERNSSGIWPSTLERYIQWMIDEFYEIEPAGGEEDQEPVTVSLEAVPGQEFIDRVNKLERITEATVRIVRPNPGWADLEDELGDVAHDSDAHNAEVTMRARRKKSLKSKGGILTWIRTQFAKQSLDYARVKGERDGRVDAFNTEKLGKHTYINMKMDDRGQVQPSDAWNKLSAFMEDLG
jgi:hypothetical protein